MTKLFHRLSTRIVLEILLAVAVSAAIYAGANAALTRFFQQKRHFVAVGGSPVMQVDHRELQSDGSDFLFYY